MNMDKLVIRELRRAELAEAARLVGRGMGDNPVNVRVFAIPEPERRVRALERFFVPVLSGVYRRGLVLGAFYHGLLQGVCAMARPGFCQPTPLERLRVLPSVALGNPIGTVPRILTQVREWARHDPPEPHWHLGPVAVEPDMQQQGVGTAMLAAFCRLMDSCSAFSYLETDKSENVRFYQKFGFTVMAEADVLGVSNWFMCRPAPAAGWAAYSQRRTDAL